MFQMLKSVSNLGHAELLARSKMFTAFHIFRTPKTYSREGDTVLQKKVRIFYFETH